MNHLIKSGTRTHTETACGLNVPTRHTVSAPKDKADIEPWMEEGKLFVTAKIFRVDCQECKARATAATK